MFHAWAAPSQSRGPSALRLAWLKAGRALKNGRLLWRSLSAFFFAVGWLYVALHAHSTFVGVRATQRERRSEARALEAYCDASRADFQAFADCRGARREVLHGGGLAAALEETARSLLADAWDAAQRRTRDAAVTLGMTGLLALGGLGLAALACDRLLTDLLTRRALAREYSRFSAAAASAGQVRLHVGGYAPRAMGGAHPKLPALTESLREEEEGNM